MPVIKTFHYCNNVKIKGWFSLKTDMENEDSIHYQNNKNRKLRTNIVILAL